MKFSIINLKEYVALLKSSNQDYYAGFLLLVLPDPFILAELPLYLTS